MSNEQTAEVWQVEANGQVFDTTFAEMTSLIDQGELLRMDRVRKGNLRWIEAGKVPSLVAVFNAKEGDQPPPPVITLTKLGPTTMPGEASSNPANFPPPKAANLPQNNGEPVCSMHEDAPAFYVCGTCFSNFCKACPSSYGGTVKICPYCGAMCNPLAKVAAAKTEAATYSAAIGEGFGFGDFAQALLYPFKFKTSLVLGAVMYMFFSIGQGALSFGGIFMLAGVLTCFMLANTLTFGVLANTVENFAQGKIGLNFMPTFEDFSAWDDVIHPFFLSIGVYISSFGPLIALVIVTFFFIASSVTKEMNPLQSDAARTVNPELPYASQAVKQSQEVKSLLNKQQDIQRERVAAIENGVVPPAQSSTPGATVVDESEESVARANESIKQMQKAQAEAVVGKSPETRSNEQWAMIKKILGYGLPLLILGGLCLLWGLFYFPAACAVAGYTRSFGATLNPTVGIDTIKRLGVDYLKILLMGLLIALMSGVVMFVLNLVFSAFDLPGMGNIPAKAIGGLFGFYFSVVFSCVIGFAMFKAADRLKLPS